MGRKAFLIWGLVIIHLLVLGVAIAQYLAFSEIIDLKALAPTLGLWLGLTPLILFSLVLHFRFKAIGRRKRIWIASVWIFSVFLLAGSWLSYFYITTVVTESGAEERFFAAIGEWAKLDDPKSATPWTLKQKLDYIFVLTPTSYLSSLGFFALLWLGSLDPRKPGNGKLQGLMRAARTKVKSARPAKKTGVSHG